MTPQDKRYQEYREACAKVDGYDTVTIHPNGGWIADHPDKISKCVPQYLLDGEIDAVVRKLDDKLLDKYVDEMDAIYANSKHTSWDYFILRAMPEQKAEALARTIMGEE